MRITKLLGGAAAALIALLAVQASAVEVYVTQDEYLDMSPGAQANFLAGVYDAHMVLLDAGLIGNKQVEDILNKGVRCSDRMTASGMRDTLNRYIANSAGPKSHAPAIQLFFALSEAC